jgi:hypothetical protein
MNTQGWRRYSTMSKLLYTVSLLCLLLTGCAGPEIKISTVMSNSIYMRDCMGPNSKWRQGDPECRHMGEPIPQYNMDQYRIRKPQRDDIVVISTCAWPDTVQDNHARSPENIRRLRENRARYEDLGLCN